MSKNQVAEIAVFSGIIKNCTKSYSILTDKESLVICSVLASQIESLTRLMLMPTVTSDQILMQSYSSQKAELISLLNEIKHQLVLNARPKPLVTES